jgi:hypothetical protein
MNKPDDNVSAKPAPEIEPLRDATATDCRMMLQAMAAAIQQTEEHLKCRFSTIQVLGTLEMMKIMGMSSNKEQGTPTPQPAPSGHHAEN